MATGKEEGPSLERSVAVRGAHRGVLTRSIKEAEEILLGVKESDSEKAFERLHTLNRIIQEKGKLLESLDEGILNKIEIDEIEVTEASLIVEKVMEVRHKIDNFLKKNICKTSSTENISEPLNQSFENSEASNVQAEVSTVGVANTQAINMNTQVNMNTQLNESLNGSINESNQSESQNTIEAHPTHEVKVTKPKLSLPKYKGDVKKWHAFWELFESLIHKNEEMPQIDKFNYLSTLHPEPFKVCL